VRFLLAVATFASFLVPRVEAAAPPTPVAGGQARVAINSDILSTNPGVLRDGNTDMVLYHIGESLVAYRDDLTVGPLLAQDIVLSDDGRSYTFTLRAGVRFHNGAPLTANEVKWTWDRLLDPRTGFRCPEFYDGSSASGVKLEEVRVIDERTVRFTLNKPSMLFLDRMANLQCQTPILHPASVGADGKWRAPIGTGPFRLGEWRRGRSVTLERFEGYAARTEPGTGLTGAKTAYLDRVTFVVVPDRIAAKTAVYAGDIDLAFAVPLGTYAELRRRAEHRRDIVIYENDTLDWTVLLLQTRDPLLADVRMRQAIAHAISVPLVAEASTFGLARSNPSAVQSRSTYHTALHDQWLKYDPERARKLAAEAGYRGETLVIQTNRRFSYMFDNAVAVQAMLASAGIDARIEVTDWATQLSNFISGRFQLSSFGYSARSHPVLLYGNFIGPKQRQASFQWDDLEAMNLLAAAENAQSTAQIGHNLDGLHRLMMKQVPLIGLYNDHVVDISKSTLRGYRPWVFGRPRLWGVWQTARDDT
jgi:peptide/nickel transport system substrate-binding protein